MIPVVLSGGNGTRLWPVSRKHLPKQFCDLFEKPLQTMTLERSCRLGNPWIVTCQALQTLTEENIKENGFKNIQVIYEPLCRNTAPAIASLCRLLELKGLQHEVVAIFPSDHLIRQEKTFIEAIKFANEVAKKNRIVTLGMTPSYPETGYGYIQIKATSFQEGEFLKAFEVIKFHEKPSVEKAKEFLDQKDFSWNAGIFVFKIAHMIELFKKYQHELWSMMSQLQADCSNLKEIYETVASVSIDYAIMEKIPSTELACVPCEVGWSDVGSWDAVASLERGHEILNINAGENFVFGEKKKNYSIVGLENVIAVDTKDALMLVKKGHSQEVRLVVDALVKKDSPLITDHVFEYRPWGYFEILKDTENFKSKVIRVNPHSQISYQSHSKREEHWTITQGQGEVILDDKIIPVKVGSDVHISVGTKHRIRNNTEQMLEFVEVQIGSYFGEDDIVRYQDDYKRV